MWLLVVSDQSRILDTHDREAEGGTRGVCVDVCEEMWLKALCGSE